MDLNRQDGLGLEDHEMRSVRVSFCWSLAVMVAGTAVAWPVMGGPWVWLAYVGGAVLAWSTFRVDRGALNRGDGGSRVRRAVGGFCARCDLRPVAVLVMALSGVVIVVELLIHLPGALEGLQDDAVAKARIVEALGEAARQGLEAAKLWFAVVGVAGVVGGICSGLSDWLWLGTIGDRLGVKPWRVLSYGRARWDWRAFAERERAGRMRYLRDGGAIVDGDGR